LNFIFGDFFPKMGVILGKFPKTREKSPKTRLEIPKNRNRYSFLGDFWEEEFHFWAFE